jgi:hypothetical protein
MSDINHFRAEVEKLRAEVEKLRNLRAEFEKMRAALEPLACTCDRPNGAACSRSEVDCPFWNARAALSAQPAPSQLDDAVNYGIGIMLDGKRIDPHDFYLTAPPPWRPIETAPTDGTVVLVFAEERQGLPAFQCTAAYHEDAGWCVDELREVTHWMPLHPPPPKEGNT